MGTLVITRTKQLADSILPYTVLVDGRRSTSVWLWSTASVAVDEGQHQIVAKILWTQSKPLTVTMNLGATVRLTAGCYVKWWRLFPWF